MSILSRILVRSAPFALLAPLAFGQAAGPEINDESVIELSPFTVDATEDTGYTATSTLAGTRIRTQLKDLGTSVQVITKDFMNDIGAVDAQDLLLFTTNTEVGGIAGNYSGEDASAVELNSSSSRSNPQSSNRVRGLFQADLTRGYFRTVIPFDSYNTGSVSINRGSNSTLFGVGSPAGIIENSPDGARWKNGGEASARFDNEGSMRGELSVNHVLIPDKLAVRGSLLQDDRRYYQDGAFQNSKRGYAAVNWKITPTTALRANFEKGQVRSNRPDSLSPLESISPWLSYGKPVLDLSLATGIGRSPTTPTGIKVDKDGDGILDDVYPSEITASDIYTYMQYPDGSFANQGNFTWNNTTKLVSGPKIITLPGADTNGDGGFINPAIFNQIAVPYVSGSSVPALAGFVGEIPDNYNVAGDALSRMGDGQDPFGNWKGTPNLSDFYNLYRGQGFTNFDGYNWGKNLLEGSTSEQRDDFTAFNVALEQTFWDRQAGIEVAFDQQSFDTTSYTPLQFRNNSDLQVDVNRVLPDGRVNPNFGRPFALARNGRSYRETELETFRVTGFLEHDFGRQFENSWAQWLGRHTLTGLYDRNTENVKSYGSSLVWGDADVRRVLGVPATDPNHFNNQVSQVVYLGPSLLGNDVTSLSDVILTPPVGLNLWQPGTTVPVTYWDPGTNPATGAADVDPTRILANGKIVSKDAMMVEGFGNGATYAHTVTDSQAAVWQSYLLKNHLVGTIGYRKDTVNNDVFKNPAKDANGFNQVDTPHQDWTGLDHSEASDSRWSYGGVLHLPERWTSYRNTQFSLHYAQSSNFTLMPGRVTWDDVPIDDPSGETIEKGFSVSTLEGRLNVRVNWFETTIQNLSSKPGNAQWNLYYQNANSYAVAAGQTNDPVFKAFNLAVANKILSFITPGMAAVSNVEPHYDGNGVLTNVTYSAVKNLQDTQDVVSKGQEIEVTFNPTKNWRMHLNVARQEAINSNVQPSSGEILAKIQDDLNQPVPGFEWLRMGQVNRAVGNPNNWTIDPVNQLYQNKKTPTAGYTTFDAFLEGKLVPYRTAKAAEGTVSPEQREWRVNFINSYTFNEGRLKGLQLGGTYRWQSEVSIGYPLINDPVTGLKIGDLANPVFAPSESSVDFFSSYTLPWFREHGRWSVRAQLSNAFAGSNDVIPVSVQPDGTSWARVRLSPQRLWVLSSTFRW